MIRIITELGGDLDTGDLDGGDLDAPDDAETL